MSLKEPKPQEDHGLEYLGSVFHLTFHQQSTEEGETKASTPEFRLQSSFWSWSPASDSWCWCFSPCLFPLRGKLVANCRATEACISPELVICMTSSLTVNLEKTNGQQSGHRDVLLSQRLRYKYVLITENIQWPQHRAPIKTVSQRFRNEVKMCLLSVNGIYSLPYATPRKLLVYNYKRQKVIYPFIYAQALSVACCYFIATFSVQPASTANVNCAGILDLQMAGDSQSHARVRDSFPFPHPLNSCFLSTLPQYP